MRPTLVAAVTMAGHGKPPNIVTTQMVQQMSVGVRKDISARRLACS